jgi:hypothetical protein
VNFFNSEFGCVCDEEVPASERGCSVGVAHVYSAACGVNAQEFWIIGVRSGSVVVHSAIAEDA